MIDPTKDNFIQSVKEVLEELEISKHHYYKALSIQKDEDLELCSKGKSNFCLVNNCFDVDLKAGLANMGMRAVSNE